MNTQIIKREEAEAMTIIENAVTIHSDRTRTEYRNSLRKFYKQNDSIWDGDALYNYARQLTPASRGIFKAAIRHIIKDKQRQLKLGVNPENVLEVQAALLKLEGIQESVTTETKPNGKPHVWLSPAQMAEGYALCDVNSVIGYRDLLLFKLAFQTGLRREELREVKFGDIQMVKKNGGDVLALVVEGKGAKMRAIRVEDDLKELIDKWQDFRQATDDDYVLVSVRRGGTLGDRLAGVSITKIVAKYGDLIEEEGLAPHDLRRSFAMAFYNATKDIAAVSKVLGHADVKTTQSYLNLSDIALKYCPGSFIP